MECTAQTTLGGVHSSKPHSVECTPQTTLSSVRPQITLIGVHSSKPHSVECTPQTTLSGVPSSNHTQWCAPSNHTDWSALPKPHSVECTPQTKIVCELLTYVGFSLPVCLHHNAKDTKNPLNVTDLTIDRFCNLYSGHDSSFSHATCEISYSVVIFIFSRQKDFLDSFPNL